MKTKVFIGPSKISGKGLFADTRIAKGEIIFLVEGPIIQYPFVPDYRRNPHGLHIRKNTWQLPLKNNPWRYVNHSCRPNAGLSAEESKVIAMKNIEKHEEITLDYSTTEADPSWHLKCNCSEPGCREIIRSIQYLPQALFETYQNFIPLFLQKSYTAEKTYTGGKKHPLRGIYAKNIITKGTKIFTITGPTVKYPFPINYRIGPTWFEIGKQSWIIPLENNPWHDINHSCAPNVGLKDKTDVVAMRDITRDEEITIDYAITEAEPDWKMICQCGAQNCRQVIRSIQFLPPDLFKKYQPYIPLFQQKVYLRHRSSPKP